MVTLGYVVGLSNFTSFPLLCYKNGGREYELFVMTIHRQCVTYLLRGQTFLHVTSFSPFSTISNNN